MRELPILMSGPFVKAIFEGKKTETRRPIESDFRWLPEDPYPWYIRNKRMLWDSYKTFEEFAARHAAYQVGDHLYVRETAYIAPPHFSDGGNVFDDQSRLRTVDWVAAMSEDAVRVAQEYGVRKTPSIHMPKWATRLWLEVTAVKAQPVTAVTYEEALAEGFPDVDRLRADENFRYGFPVYAYALANFRYWWQEQYGADAWSDKKWVFVYQFKVVERG